MEEIDCPYCSTIVPIKNGRIDDHWAYDDEEIFGYCKRSGNLVEMLPMVKEQSKILEIATR